jgi:hypothetical protein
MWAALAPVIKILVQALLPFLWEKLNAPDTLEDSQPATALRDALRERVRNSRGDGSVR